MLSNETATGKFPVETTQIMSDIITETEKSVYDNLLVREYPKSKKKIDEVISRMSRLLAEETGAKLFGRVNFGRDRAISAAIVRNCRLLSQPAQSVSSASSTWCGALCRLFLSHAGALKN